MDVPISPSLLSLELGRSIRFDPAMEKIVGDFESRPARCAEIPRAREIPEAASDWLLRCARMASTFLQ
jgi:hypothetical protein